jgi:hypothetical protein
MPGDVGVTVRLELHARLAIADRLHGCAEEIEEAILARILTSNGSGDAGHLQHVVRQALDYGVHAVEAGPAQASPPPQPLIADARRAARRSLDLQVLVSRYLSGYSQFTDFLLRETEKCRDTSASRQILHSAGTVFEHLVATIGEEYEAERLRSSRSTGARRLEKAQDLLSGKAMEAPELSYGFAASHVGMIGIGDDACGAIKVAARVLGGQLLLLKAAEGEAWGWIGRRRPINRPELDAALAIELAPSSRLAVGEPGDELSGWRRTHREARLALQVAGEARPIVRYLEVAVLSSLLRDPFLKRTLKDHYLAPLWNAKHRGREGLIETLRAYFAAGRNAASAAAALGVSRQTVSSRLQLCEERVGYPMPACARELELALLLDELEPEQANNGPARTRGR